MDKEEVLNLEIKEHPNYSKEEKETTIVMDSEGVTVYSCWSSGVRWGVERIKEGKAELLDYTIVDDYLVAIKLRCGYDLISLKSKPRGNKNKSSVFTV